MLPEYKVFYVVVFSVGFAVSGCKSHRQELIVPFDLELESGNRQTTLVSHLIHNAKIGYFWF